MIIQIVVLQFAMKIQDLFFFLCLFPSVGKVLAEHTDDHCYVKKKANHDIYNQGNNYKVCYWGIESNIANPSMYLIKYVNFSNSHQVLIMIGLLLDGWGVLIFELGTNVQPKVSTTTL